MAGKAEQVIERTVARLGYELIETEFVKARGLWRVFIDRPDSRTGVDLIGVDDCAFVTEHLLDALEEAEVQYEHLEVSSPGIDRALTKPDHFQRFAGQTIRITFDAPYEGMRRMSGLLVGLEGDCVRLHPDEAGAEEKLIPLAAISRARVVPNFQEP